MEVHKKNEKKKINIVKVFKTLGAIIAVLIAVIAILAWRSIRWMLKTWSNLSMEELVYHLKAPLSGTNSDMIISYLIQCVIITILIGIALTILFVRLRNKKKPYYATMAGTILVSIIFMIFSARSAWSSLNISAYAANQDTYSTFIDDNYVDPAGVGVTFPETKRNLIYIYLESMEITYADIDNGGAFEKNVIPELTELSKENENFSGTEGGLNGGYAMTGSTWTMAAMFSQSTGIPLLIPIDRNAMSTQDKFMPGVTSIGDILEKEGYQQTLLVGSDGAFGGRDLFFEQHGNYNIQDYNYSIKNGEIPEGYHVWWGYEDSKLFDNAKNAVNKMASSGEPFNFTLLTVDTHFEDGYVCEECQNEFGDDQYSNVMACSSRQVKEFVDWIQQQPFYENTSIVISGDHPTMDSDYCNDIDDEYVRKVYTTYINSAVDSQNNNYREYSTFDNFPTTLASLGAKIDGERLGLGTNLFSGMQTLTEKYGRDVENNELAKKSKTMEKLTEDIDTLSAEVVANPYNEDTGYLEVFVKDIQWTQKIQAMWCGVWVEEDRSDEKWYQGELQRDGSYMVKIPLEDYDYKKGPYQIFAYASHKSGVLVYAGSTKTQIDTEFENQQKEMDAITANIEVTPYNYKRGRFEVNVSDVNSNEDIQAIRCAVWSKDDQSDLRWYEAEKLDEITYQMKVWARDFGYKKSTYQIHVYAIDVDGNTEIIGETQGEIN